MARIGAGLVALSTVCGALALVGALGCSGADFQVVDDAGGADAATDSTAGDTGGGTDTGPGDTGAGKDSGVGVDTGTGDTGAGDTGAGDTGLGDTGTGDTGPGLDTGADVFDGGPACPRPPSTATPLDVSSMNCDAILAKYVPYVAEAKTCFCDADCSKVVARDLCGCGTNASPANDAYRSLEPMRKRFADLSCIISCPKIPCIEPSTGKCIFDTPGAPGKCN